jgi:hypothetical protein
MLRLRPTAISLTLNDLQLARERIDIRRRETFRNNGRVKVRRGPERSRDEAVTQCERVLIQPRRAEHQSSEASDDDDASRPQPGSHTIRYRSPTEDSSDYTDDSYAHDPSLISYQQTTRPKLVLASQKDPHSGRPEPYIPSLQLDGHFDTDSSQLLGPLDSAPCSAATAAASALSRQPACSPSPDSTNLLIVFLRYFSNSHAELY